MNLEKSEHATPLNKKTEQIGPTATALVLLTVALWGGTPVAISYAVDAWPPVAVAAIRFLLASGFMLVWCRLEGTNLILRPGQVAPSLILGVLLFVQISLFTAGVQHSTSSHGTLFINTFVFWVVAIEHFVTKTDRLTPSRLLGLLLAAAGVVLILSVTDAPHPTANDASPMDQPTLLGDGMLLASGMFLGVKIVYTKQATRYVEPGKLLFWHDAVGVVLFAAYSACFESITWADLADLGNPENLPAVWGLLYQGLVVGGFCFAVQGQLLKRHSATKLSVFAFLTPLFGISLAVILRNDVLSGWLFLSAACVTAGIVMVNRRAAEPTGG
jgi:drug/metabolite transporter (DMT)-like permease